MTNVMWERNNVDREMMKKSRAIKWLGIALFALGVALCLTGAFLMWDGSILGENHAGIATIIGIIGIGLIGGSIGLIGISSAVLAGARASEVRG